MKGTSAGAITAVLLGVGYKLTRLEEILSKMDFEAILMDSKPIADKLKGLKEFYDSFSNWSLVYSIQLIKQGYDLYNELKDKKGLFSGEEFRKWIECKIKEKFGFDNATFKDLQENIVKEGSTSQYKYLFLTGSNLSNGKCEIFSHLHTPNMIISDAVRISMSIPILLEPHKCYIKNANSPRVEDPTKINSLYVDGGLLNNYPTNMFDSTRITGNCESNFINCETLGFKLVSRDMKLEYEKLFKDFDNKPDFDNKFWTFLSMLINFYWESEESNHSDRSKDHERTIYIDDKNISAIKFDLKIEEKQSLIDSGKKAAVDFLQKRRNKKSKYIFYYFC